MGKDKDNIWEWMGYRDRDLDGDVDISDVLIEHQECEELMKEFYPSSYRDSCDDDIDDYDDYSSDVDDDIDDYAFGGNSKDYDSFGRNRSVSGITLSFSVQKNIPHKTMSAKGFWQYYDKDRDKWYLELALLDNFAELRKDYDEESDVNFYKMIAEVYDIDRERALNYFEWLLEIFPIIELSKTEKDISWNSTAYNLGVGVIYELIDNNPNDEYLCNDIVSENDLLDIMFRQTPWRNHETYNLREFLTYLIEHKKYSYAKAAYKAYLEYQKEKYTMRDLANMWDDILRVQDFRIDDELYDFFEETLNGLGVYANKVRKRWFNKMRKNSETKKEDKDDLEYDDEEEDECEINFAPAKPVRPPLFLTESCDNDDSEQLRIKKEFALSKIDGLLTKIENGEIYLDGYKSNPRLLDFCFEESLTKTYNAVCRHELIKHGIIEQIGTNLFVGKLPSDQIETIYMLAMVKDIESKFAYMRCRSVALDGEFSDDDKTLFAINAPLMTHLEKHNNLVKLNIFVHYASSIGIEYNKNKIVTKARDKWRNIQLVEQEKAKKIFAELNEKGEIKSDYYFEQKLFALIKQLYPDAIFKYRTKWLGALPLDTYIPSINTAIEYKNVVDDKNTLARFETKRKLCTENGVHFIEWQSTDTITESAIKNKFKIVNENPNE